MKIYLPQFVTVDSIYNVILPVLSEKYLSVKKEEDVVISIIYTERIDSNAIPLFMCILNTLKDYHGRPVYLEMIYNARLLYFLQSINFFYWASNELQLIEYDGDLVGGFSDFDGFDFNHKHKIMVFWPCPDYDNLPLENKTATRDILSEELRYQLNNYIGLLSQSRHLCDSDIDILKITLTEVISNARVYSKAMCYAYAQTGIRLTRNKKKTVVSIADKGVGFEKSLADKLQDGRYSGSSHSAFINRSKELGLDYGEYRDYLMILEALYYSQLQPIREMNLYRLKNMLAVNHANFRIHYNCTHIVFTHNRCYSCLDRDIFHCMKCLVSSRFASDGKNSPVKIYPKPLAGVHIDVEFIREDT